MHTISINISQEEMIVLGLNPSSAVDILEEETWATHDASITRIRARIQHDIVEATGTSKRSGEDKDCPDIAIMLSVSRAYRNLAKGIEMRALGLVEHQASIKVQRPLQLERSQRWKALQAIKVTDDTTTELTPPPNFSIEDVRRRQTANA